MRLSDFDFDLPDDSIALRPAEPRDSARFLVVRPGQALEDRVVRDLPDFLRPGDALVFNDTRVIPARLSGLREGRTTGVADGTPVSVEATLHRRIAPDRWSAFMRPGKRLKAGDRVAFAAVGSTPCEAERLDATVVEKHEGGEVVLAFDLSGPDLDIGIDSASKLVFAAYVLEKIGHAPSPAQVRLLNMTGGYAHVRTKLLGFTPGVGGTVASCARALGIDEVYCVSVNDAFVLKRWADSLGVTKVKMLPDGNAAFTTALGMLVKKENLGFGNRSWRYSMYVEDGVVKKLFIEPGASDDCPTDPFEVSDAATMLAWLTGREN